MTEDDITPTGIRIDLSDADLDSDPLLTAAQASTQIARLNRADKKRADEVDTHTDDIADIKRDVAEVLKLARQNERANQLIDKKVGALYPVNALSMFAGAFAAVWSMGAIFQLAKAAWRWLTNH